MMRYRVKGFIPLLFRSIEIDLGYYCHLDSLRCCWQEKRSLGNIIPGIFVEDDTLLRFSIKEALYKVSYVCVCYPGTKLEWAIHGTTHKLVVLMNIFVLLCFGGNPPSVR